MEIKPNNGKKERNLFFYNYKKMILQKYILQEDPS